MSALAEEGFVLLGGPLAGSEEGRLRARLIVSAAKRKTKSVAASATTPGRTPTDS
jgi:hypothetical protein